MRKNFLRFRSVDEVVVAWRNFNNYSPKVSSVDWNSINWKGRNRIVIQIRRRIYLKTVEINLARSLPQVECLNLQVQLQSLQRKLVFCQSNLLISVKQIVQPVSSDLSFSQSFSKFTLTEFNEISRLVTFMKYYIHLSEWQPSPLLFTDSSHKSTILRIPIIIDLILQIMVKNALEPAYDVDTRPGNSRSFNNSYDAINQVINSCTAVQQPWIITADLRTTFEIIPFDHLRSMVNTFPLCDLITRWLNCCRVSSNVNTTRLLSHSVIFPLLLNINLSRLEEVLGSYISFLQTQYSLPRSNPPVGLIRHLGNIVLVCETELMAQNCRQFLIDNLSIQGLVLLKSNVQLSCLSGGFNYLGVNIRTYSRPIARVTFSHEGYVDRSGFTSLLLVKPSKFSVVKVKKKIKSLFTQYRSSHLSILVKRVNPLIKDWSLYYGRFCSQRTFLNLDFYLYVLQHQYGVRNHPNKGRAWIINKYFGCFNLDREDKWVFGFYYAGKLYYMEKFSWVPRIR